MLRTPTRLWTVAGIATCLLLAFAGWFFLVGPQKAKATAGWQEVTAAQVQTSALRGQVNALKLRFEGIDAARAGLELKRQSLPATNQLDSLVLALNRAGAATGVTIDAVVPTQPIDITPVPPKPKDNPDDEQSDESSEEAPATTTVKPVVAAWPLFALPVTIRATGTSAAVRNFIRVVQSEQPRAILFISFEVGPSDLNPDGDQVTLDAQVNVFVSPAGRLAVAESPAE